MSFAYEETVWPVAAYCPWHDMYDYDYMYSYSAQSLSHVDMQHYPLVGEHWHGIHVSENCKYCFQPLVATSDPRLNYCPSCGRTQWHRL
jgi:hypothetical protein